MYFIPPEANASIEADATEANTDVGWENAIAYHEKMQNTLAPLEKEKIRTSAINAILIKARKAIGSISRPYDQTNVPWFPTKAGEFNLEESFEKDPLLHSLLVEERKPRRAEVILCLDTSLSMSRYNLALLGVSVGALALQLPSEDLAIIKFESDAKVLKSLGEPQSPEQILKKFLETPAKGLTNMEAALKLAKKEDEKGKLKRRVVILMSDGRYTSGSRPEYLVPQLPKLHILQTGRLWSNNRFFKRMSRLSGGKFIQISNFEQLPHALYTLVHEVLR